MLRSLTLVWIVALSCVLFCVPRAYAQLDDFGTVLEEILEGTHLPDQTPPLPLSAIQNIPVQIMLADDINLDDHTLVLSAYAPPPANGARIKPRLLGQTQLLLTGLSAPLNLVIAVSDPATQDVAFSRITASLLDANGNEVRATKQDAYYRGEAPPKLTLVPPSDSETTSNIPQIVGLETISGTVRLNDAQDLFRGSKLTIQLIENGLAGAATRIIAAQSVLNIDGATPPFRFEMDRGLPMDDDPDMLAFNVWIEDWAGRKTHVSDRVVAYNGPDLDYQLRLDSLKTSANARFTQNQAVDEIDFGTRAHTTIAGVAAFNPYKGLPTGSRLTLTLKRAIGAPQDNRILAHASFPVTGANTQQAFQLIADSVHFDPLIPHPVLSGEIIDPQGRVFFRSPEMRVTDGQNSLVLQPTPIY